MPECSVKDFIDRLRVSQLVDDAKLALALLACKEKHGGKMPAEAGLVAAFLIEAGLLTGWQRDKLWAALLVVLTLWMCWFFA